MYLSQEEFSKMLVEKLKNKEVKNVESFLIHVDSLKKNIDKIDGEQISQILDRLIDGSIVPSVSQVPSTQPAAEPLLVEASDPVVEGEGKDEAPEESPVQSKVEDGEKAPEPLPALEIQPEVEDMKKEKEEEVVPIADPKKKAALESEYAKKAIQAGYCTRADLEAFDADKISVLVDKPTIDVLMIVNGGFKDIKDLSISKIKLLTSNRARTVYKNKALACNFVEFAAFEEEKIKRVIDALYNINGFGEKNLVDTHGFTRELAKFTTSDIKKLTNRQIEDLGSDKAKATFGIADLMSNRINLVEFNKKQSKFGDFKKAILEGADTENLFKVLKRGGNNEERVKSLQADYDKSLSSFKKASAIAIAGIIIFAGVCVAIIAFQAAILTFFAAPVIGAVAMGVALAVATCLPAVALGYMGKEVNNKHDLNDEREALEVLVGKSKDNAEPAVVAPAATEEATNVTNKGTGVSNPSAAPAVVGTGAVFKV